MKEDLYIGYYQIVLEKKDGTKEERFTQHMVLSAGIEDVELQFFDKMAEKEERKIVLLKKVITGTALDEIKVVDIITPTAELTEVADGE